MCALQNNLRNIKSLNELQNDRDGVEKFFSHFNNRLTSLHNNGFISFETFSFFFVSDGVERRSLTNQQIEEFRYQLKKLKNNSKHFGTDVWPNFCAGLSYLGFDDYILKPQQPAPVIEWIKSSHSKLMVDFNYALQHPSIVRWEEIIHRALSLLEQRNLCDLYTTGWADVEQVAQNAQRYLTFMMMNQPPAEGNENLSFLLVPPLPLPAPAPSQSIISNLATLNISNEKEAKAVEAPTTNLNNERSECVICLMERPSFTCVPCGHPCYCRACCGNQIRSMELSEHGLQCPVCRQNVQMIIEVFF